MCEVYRNNFISKQLMEHQKLILPHSYEIRAFSPYIEYDQITQLRPNHTQMDKCNFTNVQNGVCMYAMASKVRNKSLTLFYYTKATATRIDSPKRKKDKTASPRHPDLNVIDQNITIKNIVSSEKREEDKGEPKELPKPKETVTPKAKE